MATQQQNLAMPIVLVLRSSSVNVPLQAKDVQSLNDLLNIARAKIPELGEGKIQFRYEVGGCTNCLLSCEDDFGTMLVMAGMFNPPVVQITAKSTSEVLTTSNETVHYGRTNPTDSNGFETVSAVMTRMAPMDLNMQRYKDRQPEAYDNGVTGLGGGAGSDILRGTTLPVTNPLRVVVNETPGHYTIPDDNFDLPDPNSDDYVPCEVEDDDWENDGTIVEYGNAFMDEIVELQLTPPVQQQLSPGVDQTSTDSSGTKGSVDSSQRKRSRASRAEATDWYTKVLKDIPTYDINKQPQKDRLLMSKEWANNIKGEGQVFRDGVAQYRKELSQYASKLGFHYAWHRNDAKYQRAECKLKEQDGCGWFIRTALEPVTKYCEIREANLVHTCRLAVMRNDTKRLGVKLIADIIIDKVRAQPDIKPKKIEKDLLNTHGFAIPYMKVWRGVEEARAKIFGSYMSSFDELRWYAEAIRTTNPGSIVELKTHPKDNKFHRLFFAFKASLDGFKYCRPMLFMDGTFMKNRYKGTILVATAKDGNQGLFPVAFAIVDSENTANWVWFIRLIQEHVHHHQEILYTSDRAGGILAAFDEVYDKACPNHFYCLYHLMKNLRSAFPKNRYSELHRNTMCKLLSEIAYAPNMRCYEVALQKFHNLGGDTSRQWMADLPPKRWCVAFSPQILRYGELTSNAAESFNSWILTARALPITFIIDMIRAQLMQWFVDRRKDSAKWTGAMTEMMEAKWNVYEGNESGYTIRVSVVGEEYEVLSEPTATVNLKHRTCTCWSWQVLGFPCTHAIAVISRERLDIRDLIDPYYFADSYRKAYSQDIHSIPSTERFEFLDMETGEKIQPPIMKKGAGRPQEKRFRKGRTKKIKKFVCRRCGKLGRHYWSTCQEALAETAIPIEQ